MPTQPPLTHTNIRVPCNGGKPSRPTPFSARNSKVIFHLPYLRRDSTLPGSLCLSDRCTVFLIVFFKSSAIINLSMRKVKVFSYILFSISTITFTAGNFAACRQTVNKGGSGEELWCHFSMFPGISRILTQFLGLSQVFVIYFGRPQ